MSNPFWVAGQRMRRDWPQAKRPRSKLLRRPDLALRQERPARLPAHRGRRERAMASRPERPVTPRRQERPAMWQYLEVAAKPGSLPQLVAAEAAVAEFEQPHEM